MTEWTQERIAVDRSNVPGAYADLELSEFDALLALAARGLSAEQEIADLIHDNAQLMTSLNAEVNAADELEQDMRRGVGFDGERTVIVDKRIALRVLAALRAPAAEPVAWLHTQGNYTEVSGRQLDADEVSRGWTQVPLYAAINGAAACSAETGTVSRCVKHQHTYCPECQANGAWTFAQEGAGSAGSGATLPEGLSSAIVDCQRWKDATLFAGAVTVYVPIAALEKMCVAARAAQGMADELARVRDERDEAHKALRELYWHVPLSDNAAHYVISRAIGSPDPTMHAERLAASAKGEG